MLNLVHMSCRFVCLQSVLTVIIVNGCFNERKTSNVLFELKTLFFSMESGTSGGENKALYT